MGPGHRKFERQGSSLVWGHWPKEEIGGTSITWREEEDESAEAGVQLEIDMHGIESDDGSSLEASTPTDQSHNPEEVIVREAEELCDQELAAELGRVANL